MRRRPLTPYGIAVNTRLLERGQTQQWLIEEAKKALPSKYIDSSNIYKILTGQINSPEIVGAINGILRLSDSIVNAAEPT